MIVDPHLHARRGSRPGGIFRSLGFSNHSGFPEQDHEGTWVDDVIGVAKGESNGNALNWTYELLLKVKDKTIKVTFDDWMFLQEKGILLNRAEVNKFGLNIGVVSITFLKIQ